MKRLITLFITVFILTGCSATAKQVQRGMTRDQVYAKWGNPNAIKTSKNSCCKDKNQEVWHYFGKGLQIKDPARSVMFEDDVVKYVFLR